MSIWQVEKVTVSIDGKKLLTDISFRTGSGLTMLLGPNGSGKSTLLRAMMGLVPAQGRIFLDGTELRTLPLRKQAQLAAYLPQRQTIPAAMTLLDYTALGDAPLRGLFHPAGAESRKKAEALLDQFGLSALSGQSMETLSGGEARLGALARTMMNEKAVLVLDEPLNGLDWLRQQQYLELLRRSGRTALLSIHDPVLAQQYASRIIILRGGRKAAELEADPARDLEPVLKKIYQSEEEAFV